MKYQSVQEAAQRMGVTVRAVQKWAKEGKLPGAQKVGRDWQIPVVDENSPKLKLKIEGEKIENSPYAHDWHVPMPLLNSSFPLGSCKEFINEMEDPDEKMIAYSEYYYFSGKADEAVKIAELYSNHENPSLRYSANLICMFANLSRGHTHLAKHAIDGLMDQLIAGLQSTAPLELHAVGVFTATAASVLLHIQAPQIPPLEDYLRYLPKGLQLFACYVLAHKAYLEKDYSRSLGIADTALAMRKKVYPIAEIYMHIIATMDLMSLMRVDEAKNRFIKAWDIAKQDGLIEAFGEHHGLLQGMIEIYFKKNYPDEFKQIITITKNFSSGWRVLHKAIAGRDVADNLSTTEFTVAMLYHRGWTAKEIAVHMGLSDKTINNYIQIVYTKLGITNKKELEQFMLQ